MPPRCELRGAVVEDRPLAPAAPEADDHLAAGRRPRPRPRAPHRARDPPARPLRLAHLPERAARRRRAAVHEPGGRCRRHAAAPRGVVASRRGRPRWPPRPRPRPRRSAARRGCGRRGRRYRAAAGRGSTRTTVAACSRASSPISAYAVAHRRGVELARRARRPGAGPGGGPRAAQIAMRCASPPESSTGGPSAASASPTRSSSSDAAVRSRPGSAQHRHLQRHDARAVEVGRGAPAVVLVDDAHPLGPSTARGRRQRGQVVAEHARRSGRRALETGEDAHQRALARSTGPRTATTSWVRCGASGPGARRRRPRRSGGCEDVAGVDGGGHLALLPASAATGARATTREDEERSGDRAGRNGGPQRRHRGRCPGAELDDVDHAPPTAPHRARCPRRPGHGEHDRPARTRWARSVLGGTPIASRSSRCGRSSARSAAAISTSPAAASTTDEDRAALEDDQDAARERAGRGVGVEGGPRTTARSAKSGRRSAAAAERWRPAASPTQTSCGTAVPGESAFTATESDASSATTKLSGAVGNRAPTATTRAAMAPPDGSARWSRPPGRQRRRRRCLRPPEAERGRTAGPAGRGRRCGRRGHSGRRARSSGGPPSRGRSSPRSRSPARRRRGAHRSARLPARRW